MMAARLGARSGLMVTVVGIAYGVVLGAGLARHGLSEPIVDPILAMMELLTIASALPILTLFVALQATVGRDARPWATLGLCLGAMFTLTTLGVHVFELTAGRQLDSRGLVWPSATYALELLAWDLLLGLAIVCAALALRDDPAARTLCRWLTATGVLCLIGIVGPAVGDMRLQRIGVFGYAVLLPVATWRCRAWFRAQEGRERRRDA